MLSPTNSLLRACVPLLAPGTVELGLAAFATRTSNTTAENLSTAVSVASKRIKSPKPTAPKSSRPKTPRASSAYNLFLKENIGLVKAKSPTKLSSTELFKSVSVSWKALTPAERQPYVLKAEQEKAALDAVKSAQKAEARPPNAYAKFVQELVPSLRASYPALSAPDLMRRAAEAWKLVSDAEKARRREQYLRTVEDWKARTPEKK